MLLPNVTDRGSKVVVFDPFQLSDCHFNWTLALKEAQTVSSQQFDKRTHVDVSIFEECHTTDCTTARRLHILIGFYQRCGSGMFIPDPGSGFLPIPDPGSGLSIPDPGSRISDPGSSQTRGGKKNF